MTDDWQDISTVPKDTDILVFNPVAGVYVTTHKVVCGSEEWPLGFWDGKFGKWWPQPTHWMPLPQPPKDKP